MDNIDKRDLALAGILVAAFVGLKSCHNFQAAEKDIDDAKTALTAECMARNSTPEELLKHVTISTESFKSHKKYMKEASQNLSSREIHAYALEHALKQHAEMHANTK